MVGLMNDTLEEKRTKRRKKQRQNNMNKITISNIESYFELFENKNNEFINIDWIEPI